MSLLKVTVLLGVILAADASASMLMSFYTNMGETNTKCSYDNVPVASGGATPTRACDHLHTHMPAGRVSPLSLPFPVLRL